ncbi:MAG: hypothetical protein Q8Q14_02805 [Gemmatimonadales bacterium]|nr:hypothetical protein [Gemmatimonadales bacterium]
MTPDRFFNDMQQLATQSPRDAADVANTWRNRYLNTAEEGALTNMQKGWGALDSFISGGLFGGMNGWFKAEDDDIWEDWKGLTPDDPNAGFRAAGLGSWDQGSPYVEGHKQDKERYPSMKPGTLWGVPFAVPATVLVASVALSGWLGRFTYLAEYAAVSGLSVLGAQLGDMFFYDLNMNRINKAATEAGQQTT